MFFSHKAIKNYQAVPQNISIMPILNISPQKNEVMGLSMASVCCNGVYQIEVDSKFKCYVTKKTLLTFFFTLSVVCG